MTESELIAALFSNYELAFVAVTLYVSITSGYLAVAYLAGSKLLNSQVIVISCLYCLIAALATYAVHQFLGHGYNYIQALKTIADPSSDYDASPLAHILLPLVLCAGIVASLKFMWDARHPKTG